MLSIQPSQAYETINQGNTQMDSSSSPTSPHQTITLPNSTGGNDTKALFAMMYPHLTSTAGSKIVPGLVSPTDSQSSKTTKTADCVANEIIADPVLLAQETFKTISNKHGNGSAIIQPRAPAPLVPRPVGSRLPKMPSLASSKSANVSGPARLNKFVRRLHDMLQVEKDSGIVEWRRGLLVLFSTDAFSKKILPKYFNTRNFKTFRRQLNYYGFVHVRSFSATGNTTTALWINQELAQNEANDDISAVLKLRRVEPCETAKTVEGRRQRKELALHTVEEDIGLNAKKLQMDQIRSMAIRGEDYGLAEAFLLPPPTQDAASTTSSASRSSIGIPQEVHIPTDSSHSSSNTQGTDNYMPEKLGRNALGETNTAAANVLLMLARS